MTAGPLGTRLTEPRLVRAAGEKIFARGENSLQYVRGLVASTDRARASVQGQRVYLVELDWSAPEVQGTCTCPFNANGEFCKHLVAVGLAVLGEQPAETARQHGGSVRGYLEGLEATELRALLSELSEEHPQVGEALLLRAEIATGNVVDAAALLADRIRDELRFRGFVDYRRSFSVAAEAETALDELERTLAAGGADLAAPALLIAVTKLRRITANADDSAGVLGSACQRALDLYARACREGNPDGRRLARWLVKFRDESPGWPEATLADFVAAFDDKALTVYRSAVQKVADRFEGEEGWARFEVDRMLLELADHDEDADRAIEILARGEHPKYGDIIDRLRQHGRDAEVVGWMDVAVAAGRASGRMGASRAARGGYWLDPADVAATYLSVHRPDDAVAVLRRQLLELPGAASLAALVRLGDGLGRGPDERTWALQALREQARQPHANGAALVDVALDEGDLDAAWAAAREFGPGHEWQRLAKASRDSRPADAAALHQADVEKDLVHANSSIYRSVADRLLVVRDLRTLAGEEAAFAAYLSELRETYRRRTSLMAALDRAGL